MGRAYRSANRALYRKTGSRQAPHRSWLQGEAWVNPVAASRGVRLEPPAAHHVALHRGGNRACDPIV